MTRTRRTLCCHHLSPRSPLLLSSFSSGLACSPFSDLQSCSLDPTSDLSFLTCDAPAVFSLWALPGLTWCHHPAQCFLMQQPRPLGKSRSVHKLGHILIPLCHCAEATPHVPCQVGGVFGTCWGWLLAWGLLCLIRVASCTEKGTLSSGHGVMCIRCVRLSLSAQVATSSIAWPFTSSGPAGVCASVPVTEAAPACQTGPLLLYGF